MTRQDEIQQLMNENIPMKAIARKFDISRQRLYYLIRKYKLEYPPDRHIKHFWKNQSVAARWLWKKLGQKQIKGQQRWNFWKSLVNTLPIYCPILGVELNYLNPSMKNNRDASPSIDRLDSNKGYEIGNISIMSYRANRIKNDGTAEEHQQIAWYLKERGLT